MPGAGIRSLLSSRPGEHIDVAPSSRLLPPGKFRHLCAGERQGDDMRTRRRLKGRTIAALAADGFEKVELIVPLRALKAAGAKVDVVSLRRGRIRGVNLHMPASRVGVDKTIGEADPGDYDGLLLPGGFINPDLLRQSAPAREFVRAFAASDKPIATLCHGPWVLASAGLLDGRILTSWPGIRDDLVSTPVPPGSTGSSSGTGTSSRAEGPRTWPPSSPECSMPSRGRPRSRRRRHRVVSPMGSATHPSAPVP
jgi:PfpI family intracellular protease